MQILEGDLLRKMNSSRTKREIKGRKKEREQEETRDKRTKEKNASRKKREIKGRKKEREIKGRKKEREQEETRPEMSSVCKHPKPSPCIK